MKDNKQYIINNHNLMEEWLWDKNNSLGLDPNKLTIGSKKRVWWICKNCSYEWQSTICNRIHGTGCPECGKKLRAAAFKKTILQQRGSFAEQCPELLDEWDYSKNTISPFEITAGSKEKVWWICKIGHSWQDSLTHRVHDKRYCPKCSKQLKTSFPEQAIYFYFKQVTNAKNRASVYGKEIDIYLEDIKIGIEYNGRYWHRNRKENDIDKINFFNNLGINIITVVEGDCNDIKDNIITYCKDLNFAIFSLFKMCKIKPPIIDIEKHRIKIYEQYIQIRRENNLVVKFPDIAAEWHPTKNGQLKPEMFGYSSNKTVWWQCSNCKKEWKSKINTRTSKNKCKCASCNIIERGLKTRGKNHYRSKPIVQCDMSNNVINIWYCAADVERSLGISHGNIAACCSGNMAQQSAGGYKWYYLYDKITDKKIFLAQFHYKLYQNKI